MKLWPLKLLPLILLVLLFNHSPAVSSDAARDLYFKAKTSTMEQDWDHALELYKMIVEHYSSSTYYDESQFWIGYCYEKTKDGLEKAFATFDELVTENPNSTWRDDALTHQIIIAEKLAHSDDKTYRDYLFSMLKTPDSYLQLQATIALARNGFSESLPYLKSIPRDEELWEEAQVLIREFEQDTTGILENTGVKTETEFKQIAKKPAVALKSDGKKIRYYTKQRFTQYQELIKPNDEWNYQDLIDFGLWHILRSDLFDYYNMLNRSEKDNWLRKFWFASDPTPTTEINEARQEFERRVQYARDNYSYFDNLPGHFYAPWDARGEIYIKYGEPHSIKIRGMEEYWYYPQYDHLHFMIRRYVTNIFGRAIFPRYGSKWSMWNNLEKLDNSSFDLIYKPVFIYKHNYLSDKVDILGTKMAMRNGRPVLQYSFPAKLFKVHKDGQGYYLDYIVKYAIYNTNYFQIHSSELNDKVYGDKSEFKEILVEKEIALDLAPGDYHIGVRIEDKSAKKISLSKQDFSVKIMEPATAP